MCMGVIGFFRVEGFFLEYHCNFWSQIFVSPDMVYKNGMQLKLYVYVRKNTRNILAFLSQFY